MVTRRARFQVWWRRSGLGLRLTVFMLGSALLGFLVYSQRPTEDSVYQGSYLLMYLLVNTLIVVLCILAFLVGRNIVKLVFDRRRRILGSQLRLKLVAGFVGLTLIPTIILFLLASGLLTNAFGDLFSDRIESAVDGAIEIARRHYSLLESEAKENALSVSRQLATQYNSVPSKEELHQALDELRISHQLFSLRIVDRKGVVFGDAENAAGVLEEFAEPSIKRLSVAAAAAGTQTVQFEEREANKFFRAYLPLHLIGSSEGAGPVEYVLISTSRIPPEVTHANGVIRDFYTEYEQLRMSRSQLRIGNVLTLLMITTLLLFAALWFGFYLAKEITVPIQRLAEGTQAVARGNYDVQVRAGADDEIGFLVRSFNKMTLDIKNSRREGERRRLYMETILENLMISVVGLDQQGVVTSVNSSAVRLFGFDGIEAVIGKTVHAVFREQDLEKIRPVLLLLNEKDADGREVVEQEIGVSSQGRELKIVLTAGKIKDGHGNRIGTVLLFDDITEISKAQHMAAWREVARRIAHEIKNPLTPIQLSAQRLEKLTQNSTDSPAVRECTQAIVENVDSIKRLANEFSNFARMPTAEFKKANLNSLVADVLAPYAENHSEITFQFIADSRAPEILMDGEQLRRVLINLLDNAIAAITEEHGDRGGEPPRVVMRTNYERKLRIVTLEVADNGPGISATNKNRIFEPYFSTRKEGTGLGLAIVTSIITDHQGVIRVFDNEPRGAKFVVELPEEQRATTQRKYAAS